LSDYLDELVARAKARDRLVEVLRERPTRVFHEGVLRRSIKAALPRYDDVFFEGLAWLDSLG
jgi:hypothetical protein